MRQIIAIAPHLEPQIVAKKAEFCAHYGGQRYFVPKGAKRMTTEQRQAVFADGLTAMDDDEIIKKHKISKTTLWRVMKSGGGRFSA